MVLRFLLRDMAVFQHFLNDGVIGRNFCDMIVCNYVGAGIAYIDDIGGRIHNIGKNEGRAHP
ncbi:hypothetical protein SDC9_158782 [bioreactor metagenome]|uniref:Uncharacterized protein n=1 Tax=bioreactor metagenome TaxID=1076179 RepID=A0A645FDP8_9ZZZZ